MRSNRSLARKHVESFDRLGIEVAIETPHGLVWLVPRKTTAQRIEITAAEVLQLAGTAQVFHAHVTSISPGPVPELQQAQLFD